VTEDVGSRCATDPARGWRKLAADGIEIFPVAGDNLSLFDEGIGEALAKKLRFCLARVYRNPKEIELPVIKPTFEVPALLGGKV
jgi:hypothetical protein